MNSHAVLFLKMSGFVSSEKHKDIEQTLRYIFGQISPRECIEHYYSLDVFNAGYFHFYSTWISADALSGFLHSDEYQLLEGMCQNKGVPESNQGGQLSNMRTRQPNDN